ncbi:probable NADH-cytochrome b5 reductase 2 [Saccharomycodes ludwigii]|uniref:NADH-cytochrome b5 reductase n=1 Tax=Saccharomycodes ludwigii TaxID=36035 RepID=A0A376BAS9_9ASCO|nr:hypothetical protein SCDLUD_004771 [Saccharomycodes ludwigii]KAH3899332.1 hypothetical protein SCDLUD_004771 [Saccharomycodes ludwigii]SSD61654.1 probable NADH-cytochrome b5 reductase 2 [Saccharomycodes ludwigii]
MFARIASHKRILIPTLVAVSAATAFTLYNSTSRSFQSESSAKKVFIGDNAWIDLPISKIESLSTDTKRFTFKLPTPDSETGLIVASAILAKYVTPKGSNVIRPYTPVSDIHSKGEFQLVIKHYQEGKFTTHLFGLKENDTVSFKGPIVKWEWKPNQFKSLTLLGGGTGITPLYQMIHHIAENPEDKTKINLIYGSKSPADILLKKELDEVAAKYPEQVKITYFVDDSASATDYQGKTGYITKEFLQENIAKPAADNHVFICGPPGFMTVYSGKKVGPTDQGEVTGILKELGFTKDEIFKF